jgi:hypothetical protein
MRKQDVCSGHAFATRLFFFPSRPVLFISTTDSERGQSHSHGVPNLVPLAPPADPPHIEATFVYLNLYYSVEVM